MISKTQNKKSIFACAVLALLLLAMLPALAEVGFSQGSQATFSILQPKNNSAFISDVLFVSWENVASEFKLELYREGSPERTIATENAYHQFSGLAPGNYTLQAFAIVNGNVTGKSSRVSVALKSTPKFFITINTSEYKETKAVKFNINAPTGCALSLNVSSSTAFIPYETKNLVAKTITIYLEPAFYWMNAVISCDGIRQTFYDTFTLDDDTESQDVAPTEPETEDDEEEKEQEPEADETVRLTVAVIDQYGRSIRALTRLQSDETTISKVAGEGGNAVFVVSPGAYTLTAEASGFLAKSQNITLDSDRQMLVELERTVEPAEEEEKEDDEDEGRADATIQAGRGIALIEPSGTFFEGQGIPIRYRTDGLFESCRVNLVTEGLPGFRTLVNNQNVQGEVAFIEEGILPGRYRAYVRCVHQNRVFESNWLSFSVIQEIEGMDKAKEVLEYLESLISKIGRLGEKEKEILAREGITNAISQSASRLKDIISGILDEGTTLSRIESLEREMVREIENAETRMPFEIEHTRPESKIISTGRSSIKENSIISEFIESRIGSKSDRAIDSVVDETNSKLIFRESSKLILRYKDYTREICIEQFSSDKGLEGSFVFIEGDAKSLEHNIIKGINPIEKDVLTVYADCQRIGRVEVFAIGDFEESRNLITASFIGLANLGSTLWILISLIIVGASVIANYAVRTTTGRKEKGEKARQTNKKATLKTKKPVNKPAMQPAIIPEIRAESLNAESLETQLLKTLEDLYLELHSGAVKTKRINSYFELIDVIPKEIKTKYASVIGKIDEKIQEKNFEKKFNQIMASIRTIDLSKLDEMKKMEIARAVSDLVSDYNVLPAQSQASLSSLMQRIDSLTRIIK